MDGMEELGFSVISVTEIFELNLEIRSYKYTI